MNIDSCYSIVFSGLQPKPYFASSTGDATSLMAVASSNGEYGASLVTDALEALGNNDTKVSQKDLESVFSQVNSDMQLRGLAASAAGVLVNDTDLLPFNIGNARVLLFSDGNLIMHSEDQTEAYMVYRESAVENAAAYDKLRTKRKSLALSDALGSRESSRPVFYPPWNMRKNDAILLCTERFWHYLSVMEMELDFRKAAGADDWLKIMTRRVLMKADRELDMENFAAVAAIVGE